MPAFFPPTFAMTLPPSTSGEPAAPKNLCRLRTGASRRRSTAAFPSPDRLRGASPRPRTYRRCRRRRPGRRAAFIESEIVAIRCRIRVPPLRRAGQRIERLDGLTVVSAMKQNEARAGDDRATEALTDLLAPDDTWARRRPLLVQRRAYIDAVARWTKELRPVAGSERCGSENKKVIDGGSQQLAD